jgi:nitrite reductase/ring-hydroxylating ferredoxin subunit
MDERLRDDFSIDWEEDRYVSRREFFKFMTVASGGLAVGTAVLAGWSRAEGEGERRRLQIVASKDLPKGRAIQFTFPDKDDLCILVHRESGEFVAFSRRCTHLSCPVQFQAEQNRLYCPCHNGAFSLEDGSPTQGPPTRALRRIEIEVEKGVVYATGVAAP